MKKKKKTKKKKQHIGIRKKYQADKENKSDFEILSRIIWNKEN